MFRFKIWFKNCLILVVFLFFIIKVVLVKFMDIRYCYDKKKNKYENIRIFLYNDVKVNVK